MLIGNQDTYFRANRDWLYLSESSEFNAKISQPNSMLTFLNNNEQAQWLSDGLSGLVARLSDCVTKRSPTMIFSMRQLRLFLCATGIQCARYACFYLRVPYLRVPHKSMGGDVEIFMLCVCDVLIRIWIRAFRAIWRLWRPCGRI